MPRPHSALTRRDRGFTLIELLVVILILGVLAAIAVPVFIGAQNGARDAGAKSDLDAARVAVVRYWSDLGETASPPTFDSDTRTGLVPRGWNRTASTTASVAFRTGSVPRMESFCIQAQSTAGGWFHTDQAASIVAGPC